MVNKNNTEELTNYLCLKKVETFNDLQKLLDIADIFLNIPNNLFENLNQTSEEKISKDINKICECITNFNSYNNAIKEHYSLNIINDDLDLYINLFKEYSKSPIKKFSINYLKSILHLQKFFISQYKPTTAQIYEDLKKGGYELNNSSDIEDNNLYSALLQVIKQYIKDTYDGYIDTDSNM